MKQISSNETKDDVIKKKHGKKQMGKPTSRPRDLFYSIP